MITQFEPKLNQDPELVEDEQSDDLSLEEKYDQMAVSSTPFDSSQFVLPDDFEVGDEE